MRRQFDQQLALLNRELIEMGALCEEVIALAAKALTEGDPALAAQVGPLDTEIDQKERTIESLCLKLLLQQQPVARDLRQISAALKMITDMERIGDQAQDISEIVTFLRGRTAEHDDILCQMARATISMVTESVDAFVKHDTIKAEAVLAADDTVDAYFRQVKQALISRIAADPGDGKAMVRARRAFLSAGHYAPLMATLAALCAALPHDHIVDAGCGEGSYDKYLYDALGCPQIAAFDLSKEAVRLASKLVPDAAFCVGGSFCAPVRDGWADLLLNIFSPMAEAEFTRMLRPGGHLVYAVPTARHLFGLKEILYDCPYENEVRQTEYDGFAFVKAVESTAVITLEGQSVQDLFAMTPYYWNTPADGAARLAECERLTTEIGFRFLVYQKV